ncbi:hypothetical protein [Perigonia lusca single nucleopolyhedrovirus]|uniref:Uncharacterized protein n=1 Tax=Perigonia lusca single nucleopolyhedrovirus TaxID=1675865 RepID=A0A0M3N1Z5_9ABAC|nr:hypothetical protein [Perigonia lusca single nucleopolyhedrovirus]AKN80624.1 hypothetical protein [Perigonia lusca single nucleopolyhedrovirus]
MKVGDCVHVQITKFRIYGVHECVIINEDAQELQFYSSVLITRPHGRKKFTTTVSNWRLK